MKYRAGIFDMDGTLLHTSIECIRFMVGESFRVFGVCLSDMEKDMFWYSYKREKMLDERGIDPGSFWEVFRKYDTPELRKRHASLYGDAKVIEELKQNGYKIGIVTGAPFHMIEIGKEMLGSENIDVVVRAQRSSGIEPKPSPRGIMECLKLMGMGKEKTFCVGNGDEDVIAARAAGILDVLVIREDYIPAKVSASLEVKSLYDLRNFLGLE